MSLPEMEGGWDELFDETYLTAYSPFLTDERAEAEAEGAIALAAVLPPAKILDAPCGFGRHSLLLAEAGYRVTGIDRSETQLGEALRRRGDAEWPRLERADYRALPFADASFDAVLNLFSSLGYLDRAGDVSVLAEFRRVLRPGGALVVETMHRDRLARIYTPRMWDPLEDDVLFLQEREVDWVTGAVATHHLLISAAGERVSRRFVHRGYTATEWTAMLREAGFEQVECFGGWEREPLSPDTRLFIRAEA